MKHYAQNIFRKSIWAVSEGRTPSFLAQRSSSELPFSCPFPSPHLLTSLLHPYSPCTFLLLVLPSNPLIIPLLHHLLLFCHCQMKSVAFWKNFHCVFYQRVHWIGQHLIKFHPMTSFVERMQERNVCFWTTGYLLICWLLITRVICEHNTEK